MSEKSNRRLVSSRFFVRILDWLLVSACWAIFRLLALMVFLVCSERVMEPPGCVVKVFLNWEDVVRWSWFSLRYTEP